MTSSLTSPGHLSVASRGRFQISYKATASFIVTKAAGRYTEIPRAICSVTPHHRVDLCFTGGRLTEQPESAWPWGPPVCGLVSTRSLCCPGPCSLLGPVQAPSREVDIRAHRTACPLLSLQPVISISTSAKGGTGQDKGLRDGAGWGLLPAQPSPQEQEMMSFAVLQGREKRPQKTLKLVSTSFRALGKPHLHHQDRTVSPAQNLMKPLPSLL